MFSPDDTIVAVATPTGRGAIGIVRISGAKAVEIASAMLDRQAPLQPRRATLATIRGTTSNRAQARPIDEAVVTWFPCPHSFTGQHVVEISAHGSPVVLDGIVRLAISCGARLARAGEFTLRAFLAGTRDLVQAEAVADLIAAASPLQAQVAFDQLQGTLTAQIASIDDELLDLTARLEASLDFPEEGFHFIDSSQTAGRITQLVNRIDVILADAPRGRMIREGATVVIVGRTNVGKSSIFNRLCGVDRAIVTDVPGTTRDLVTERVDLDGLAITVVDTAGTRATTDAVEWEGIKRATQAREVADAVVLVLDQSEPAVAEDVDLLRQTTGQPRVVVLNKVDRPPRLRLDELPTKTVPLSTVTGLGVDELRSALTAVLAGDDRLQDSVAISNVRHIQSLENVHRALERAREAAVSGASEEFVVSDLQVARRELGEVLGVNVDKDAISHIFERFCIGK